MSALLERVSGSVYAWALTRRVAGPAKRPEVRRLIKAEIAAIAETVGYQQNERALLASRLSRRYDPGLALNEAANRAIADKKAAREVGAGSTEGLSARQLAALEFQKQYLKRVVDQS